MSAELLATPKTNVIQDESLSQASLHLLAAFIEELIQEEQLGHRAQVLLHRIATPIFMLAGGNTQTFYDRNYPGRQIFDAIILISKLSGKDFSPSDMLFKTLLESIKTLKSRKIDGLACLKRVNTDLQHIVKLARIRAPIDKKHGLAETGKITEAKIKAALMVVHQANRFSTSDIILYFSLTQWLELLTIVMLKYSQNKTIMTTAERLTFLLFFLAANPNSPKYSSLYKQLDEKLKILIPLVGKECLGHCLHISSLHLKVGRVLEKNRSNLQA
ncbi:MAG: hypothetical protein ACI93R_002367 [Flavobacteriales bacterium]|jgi:hypothetical protein